MADEKLHNVEGTSFPCPKCGKEIIHRTGTERKIASKYQCSNCGFTGPN